MSLCECGCGETAPVAQRNRRDRGWVKGEPIRFISGHHLYEKRFGPETTQWKGDEVSYNALHQWVLWHKVKTGVCTGCGRRRETQWANLSGVYLRDLDDYVELCVPCHRELDDEEWYDKLH
jgi:hypothetical protein